MLQFKLICLFLLPCLGKICQTIFLPAFSLFNGDLPSAPVGICKARRSFHYVKRIDLLTLLSNVRIWLYLKKSTMVHTTYVQFSLPSFSLFNGINMCVHDQKFRLLLFESNFSFFLKSALKCINIKWDGNLRTHIPITESITYHIYNANDKGKHSET